MKTRTDLFALILAVFVMVALYLVDYPDSVQEASIPQTDATELDTSAVVDWGDPTPDKVLTYLIEIGVEHPEIVAAQAVLETGWFNCTNCSLDFNNLFGFIVGGEYLRFDTWPDSCDYYLIWQQNRYGGGDYYEFLRLVGYAVDTLYTQKVRSVASTIAQTTQ